ncbi:MAG TPA: HNH endonuclease [Acidobacteriota bacterium]|nr:HNH endonuclease [Acidobacteriota bacterium]
MTIGKCIFCLENKELTKEHIVPDSIGGGLEIEAVCADCNSTIGTKAEGAFINSLLMSLPRFFNKIPGKSGDIPNPFAKVGITSDGFKVRADENLNPHILPQVTEGTTPSGDINLQMIFDKTDEHKMPEELLKKLLRILKTKFPLEEQQKLELKAQELADEALKNRFYGEDQVTIKVQHKFRVADAKLECIKIAYETAFYMFGYGYVENSVTGNILRTTINKQKCDSRIKGSIFLVPDPFSHLFTDDTKHIVMLLNGMAYIKLFGLTAMIQYEENEERFMAREENATILYFDFQNKRYKKEPLIEAMARKAAVINQDAVF